MTAITVSTIINAPINHIWEMWNNPEHIKHWAFASDDWCCPAATNDLRVGGKFITTMAAKDNSASFDFIGTYTKIEEDRLIEYTIEDGRIVSISFETLGDSTKVTEIFDMELMHTEEQQRAGRQSILDNFKKHAEQGGVAS